MEQEGPQNGLIIFAERAKKDLLEIAEYTQRTWGEAQSEAYLDLIFESARSGAANSSVFKITMEGEVFFRKLVKWRRSRYGHHIYFIQVSSGQVCVIRVLHTSQAPPTDVELIEWLETR